MPGGILCESHSHCDPPHALKVVPDIEKAMTLLSSEATNDRMLGVEMLCDLHADDLIVAHAMKESDQLILDYALKELTPHPIEFIRHLLMQPSQHDAWSYMKFHVARGNFLYAEETIRESYGTRPGWLWISSAISPIGEAYLRSFAPLLRTFLSAPLETYLIGQDGTKAGGYTNAGCCAIASIVSLSQIDCDFDIREAERLLEEARRVHAFMHRKDLSIEDFGFLEWVLFHRGARTNLEMVVDLIRKGAAQVMAELATTLLKRREDNVIRRLIDEFPIHYFLGEAFSNWPLLNWLEANGYFHKGEHESGLGIYRRYWRARELDIDPPPWWKWQ